MNLRTFLLTLVATALFACGGADHRPVTPPEPEPLEEGEPPVIFSVSGRAAVHPSAADWLVSQGQTVPSLEGLALVVSEPVRLALGEEARLAERVLDASGEYQVSELSTASLVQEIAGEIQDPTRTGAPVFVRSATTLYDYWLEGGQPREDVTHTRTYALPATFEAKLTELVTPGAIASLQAEPGAQSLQAAGFILGRVTDVAGAPVAGARVQLESEEEAKRLFYVTADYSGVTTDQTSANGLFLYVHSGTVEPKTVKFTLANDGYEERSAVAVKDVATLVDVYPGRTRPR